MARTPCRSDIMFDYVPSAMTFMTFMTHGNVTSYILESQITCWNMKNVKKRVALRVYNRHRGVCFITLYNLNKVIHTFNRPYAFDMR